MIDTHYHLQKMTAMHYRNCLSDASNILYTLYSLYLHTTFAYISRDHFLIGEMVQVSKISVFSMLFNE